MVIYKLHFTAPLHMGTHYGVGYEKTENFVHSDTLWSAMMNLWRLFYDDQVSGLCRNPPFVISSAFPFKGETLFFPMPAMDFAKPKDSREKKKLKKVAFISQTLLEAALHGGTSDFDEKETLHRGEFWAVGATGFQKTSQLYSIREVPRIYIDRRTNETDIFYFSEIIFEKDAGLFFLVRYDDPGMQKKFEAVLRLLGDEGLGSDKRMGRGCFQVEVQNDYKIRFPDRADGFITFSLYHPTRDEYEGGLLEGAAYELALRTGWLHAEGAMALRRKDVRMFTEGSVFRDIGKNTYGDVITVLNKNKELGLTHDIFRYGIAFSLPMIRRTC